MYDDKPISIRIKDIVSSDLALRDSADTFFDKIELKKNRIIEIDFSDIVSISRSFAHQYIIRKNKSRKTIVEVNIPDTIVKMFRIIEMQEKNISFLDNKKIKIMYL